jgi:hypothetical protein
MGCGGVNTGHSGQLGTSPIIFLRKIHPKNMAGHALPGFTMEESGKQAGRFNGKTRIMCIRRRLPVTIKDDRTGYQYAASMQKCGNRGMYLESNYAPRPGSTMHILPNNRNLGTAPSARPAVIQWRELMGGSGSSWVYRLGIKYV